MKIKTLMAGILTITLLTVVGCSSTKKIGTIGGIDFYKVHASQFDGPNFTALVTHQTNENIVNIGYVFGSGGIGTSIIAAGGNVGAAALLGTSFPKNVGDSVNMSGGNSQATSTSTSGRVVSPRNSGNPH